MHNSSFQDIKQVKAFALKPLYILCCLIPKLVLLLSALGKRRWLMHVRLVKKYINIKSKSGALEIERLTNVLCIPLTLTISCSIIQLDSRFHTLLHPHIFTAWRSMLSFSFCHGLCLKGKPWSKRHPLRRWLSLTEQTRTNMPSKI